MIAAIHPMHALGAGVCAVVEIERQSDLIAKAFFGRQRLMCLILRGRQKERTTEETEEKRTGQCAKGKVVFEQQ